MSDTCGCCEGIQRLTPAALANRPGLSALRYRVGTHGSFLETMKARLSSSQYPVLRALATRDGSDPAIALLDAWAAVADVLTFYQERIANEGYLRTATERRSILELARLIGYRLRPGVSASVYLAFTTEDGFDTEVPAGTRAQSVPGKGEKPQPFETSELLKARSKWNSLQPRVKQPQYFTSDSINDDTPIYLDGTTTRLKPNSPLLVTFDSSSGPKRRLYRTLNIIEDPAAKRTKMMMWPWNEPFPPRNPRPEHSDVKASVDDIVARYTDVKEFGLAVKNDVVKRVTQLLTTKDTGLQDQIGAATDDATRLTILDRKIAELEDILGTFNVTRRRLHEWLSGLIGELDAVRKDLTKKIQDAEAAKKSSTPPAHLQFLTIAHTGSGGPLGAGGQMGGSGFPWPDPNYPIPVVEGTIVLATMGVPNPRKLPRDPDQIYAAKSDMIARALVTVDPEFGAQQYYAKVFAKVPPAESPRKPPLDQAGADNSDKIVTAAMELDTGKTDTLMFLLQNLKLTAQASVTVESSLEEWTIVDGDKKYRIEKVYLGKINLVDKYELRAYIIDAMILSGIEVLRVQAPLFGHNNPGQPYVEDSSPKHVSKFDIPTLKKIWGDYWHTTIGPSSANDGLKVVVLDKEYPEIKSDSWIVIAHPQVDSGGTVTAGKYTTAFRQIDQVQTVSLSANGISASVSVLTLKQAWLTQAQFDSLDDVDTTTTGTTTTTKENPTKVGYSNLLMRQTRVYAQPELLTLVDMPITDPIEGDAIELAERYDGLDSGRWLIVSGERADVFDDFGNAIGGLKDSEQVMVDRVIQDVQHIDDNTDLPGDSLHSFLKITPALSHAYKPGTVTIYANVVKATHGETLSEVFGSGDGSLAFQQFALRQTPLTYVAAPTAAGAGSTLVVRVNGVQWHETDAFVGLGPKDRRYIIRIDDDGKTSFMFGNGRQGARLPTGVENVKGQYRRGIGKPGNVRAKQISLLAQKPLHVKGVVNPMAASGGADPESRDQARRTAPLAVAALDRLVSVRDYADFARTFAGISKADAVRLSDGRREVVHLTIAGLDDIPIDQTSDLYRNLKRALQLNGEPHQPVVVEWRALALLIIRARVRLLPDYDWDLVEPQIRSAALGTFSFDRRELGQDVTRSEVISAIQAVAGVAYVDLENLDSVDEQRLKNVLQNNGERTDPDKQETLIDRLQLGLLQRVNPELAHVDKATGRIVPAQLTYLDPNLPDTLMLEVLQA